MDLPKPAVIARIVHEVLDRQRFTSRVDLAEAVKWRCAALKLRYNSALVDAAIVIVARSARAAAVPASTAADPAAPPERPDTGPPPISRAEAAAILAEISARTGVALWK